MTRSPHRPPAPPEKRGGCCLHRKGALEETRHHCAFLRLYCMNRVLWGVLLARSVQGWLGSLSSAGAPLR